MATGNGQKTINQKNRDCFALLACVRPLLRFARLALFGLSVSDRVWPSVFALFRANSPAAT